MRVLTLLIERRGELVMREELREQLWPADTFVDLKELAKSGYTEADLIAKIHVGWVRTMPPSSGWRRPWPTAR